MKKNLRVLLMTVAASIITLFISAQQKPENIRGDLEVFFGINLFGPQNRMGDLMSKYGFDATTSDWLYGGTISHPSLEKSGTSGYISYSHCVGTNKKGKLGVIFGFANFGEVLGASDANDGYLFVKLSNLFIAPTYTYEAKEFLSIVAGPAVLMNKGYKTSLPTSESENYKRISPGLLAGVNLRFWNSRILYFKFNTSYMLAFKNKMGPYTSHGLVATETLPESKIGFSNISTGVAIGLHIR